MHSSSWRDLARDELGQSVRIITIETHRDKTQKPTCTEFEG